MPELTVKNKLELAEKISQLMDDFFAEKQCQPDEDVLLLALHARTDAGHRAYLIGKPT